MEKNQPARADVMSAVTHRVGRIAASDLLVLAAYRSLPHWQLRADGTDAYWLRVAADDEEIFPKLPLLGRWTADATGQLTREGHRVPEAVLPQEGWREVADLLPIVPPRRGAPGMPAPAVAFQLVPDDAGHAAGALICHFADFSCWASTALSVRIECLRFACCEDGRAMVVGSPLPPLPGAGFHRMGRLWLPCGWRLPDHVWPELLEEILGLGSNRMSLLHPDGSHEEVDQENLIPATRPAVRTTKPA